MQPVAVWRNYEEVFDLAIRNGQVIAATNGGLIARDGSKWIALSFVAGLRKIDQTSPLLVGTASGKHISQNGTVFGMDSICTRERTIQSGLLVGPNEAWLVGAVDLRSKFPSAPPSHVYCVLKLGGMLIAGTSNGLYSSSDGTWSRESLPSSLPTSRPNGFVAVDGTNIVGGINGLYIGKPGQWKSVCTDSIKQLQTIGSDVWVVHGNGALDKLDLGSGRLFPDVLTGASKRPWTSIIGISNKALLFGGLGGWTQWGQTLSETYPQELKGDVVTSITGNGDTRWIGTEQYGVFRFRNGKSKAWNPGNGLDDTWVTALCRSTTGLWVATLHAGLFQIAGDKISAVPCPSKRLTQLKVFKNQLVVGAMDGAWIYGRDGWERLATGGEETTSLGEVGGELCVTTAQGIYMFEESVTEKPWQSRGSPRLVWSHLVETTR